MRLSPCHSRREKCSGWTRRTRLHFCARTHPKIVLRHELLRNVIEGTWSWFDSLFIHAACGILAGTSVQKNALVKLEGAWDTPGYSPRRHSQLGLNTESSNVDFPVQQFRRNGRASKNAAFRCIGLDKRQSTAGETAAPFMSLLDIWNKQH
jgi:hypothetical protein